VIRVGEWLLSMRYLKNIEGRADNGRQQTIRESQMCRPALISISHIVGEGVDRKTFETRGNERQSLLR